MTAGTDLMSFVVTIGGGFFVGLLVGYVIRKIIKIGAVIVDLLIAALAYLEFQRIIDVNWAKIQTVSENGFTWVTNTIIHISKNISPGHTEALSNFGIPLTASVSAGFALGMVRGQLNFQKRFGPLTRSRENRFFDEIIGNEHIESI